MEAEETIDVAAVEGVDGRLENLTIISLYTPYQHSIPIANTRNNLSKTVLKALSFSIFNL